MQYTHKHCCSLYAGLTTGLQASLKNEPLRDTDTAMKFTPACMFLHRPASPTRNTAWRWCGTTPIKKTNPDHRAACTPRACSLGCFPHAVCHARVLHSSIAKQATPPRSPLPAPRKPHSTVAILQNMYTLTDTSDQTEPFFFLQVPFQSPHPVSRWFT